MLNQSPLRHRASRPIVGVLALLTVVNLGIATSYPLLWGSVVSQGLYWRADFTAFYTGGLLVQRGITEGLYDYGLQAEVQREILDGQHLAGGLLAFNYPPHVALLVAPLTKLQLRDAYIVWSVIQFGLVIALGIGLWRYGSEERYSVRGRLAITAATLALPAVMVTLLIGAFSMLMLVALLGFVVALKRGDDVSAALWVLVTSLKPQVALVPAVILLAARRWRAVSLALAGLLVVVGVCAVALGVDSWRGFLAATLTTFRAQEAFGVSVGDMVNFRGFLQAISCGQPTDRWVSWVSLGAFLCAQVAIVALWLSDLPNRYLDLVLGWSVLVGVFFSLHANPQDGFFVVPAALLFNDHRRGLGCRQGGYTVFLFACPALLLIAEYLFPTGLSIPAMAASASVLLIWMTVGLWHAWATSRRGID